MASCSDRNTRRSIKLHGIPGCKVNRPKPALCQIMNHITKHFILAKRAGTDLDHGLVQFVLICTLDTLIPAHCLKAGRLRHVFQLAGRLICKRLNNLLQKRIVCQFLSCAFPYRKIIYPRHITGGRNDLVICLIRFIGNVIDNVPDFTLILKRILCNCLSILRIRIQYLHSFFTDPRRTESEFFHGHSLQLRRAAVCKRFLYAPCDIYNDLFLKILEEWCKRFRYDFKLFIR